MLQEGFGSGYDIIILNAICHMFSLLRRGRQALAPNGRVAVQDFVLNPDKAGPQHAALFSLNMSSPPTPVPVTANSNTPRG